MWIRALVTVLMAALPFAAMAEGRQTLGWGRLFDNDALGDFHDRWQTGSATVSVVRGPDWTGELPGDLGSLLEFRFVGRAISAGNLSNPAQNDRRYAGLLSLGVHSHFNWLGFEGRLGADLVGSGPQTGVGAFQSWLHEALGVGKPDLGDQLGNAVYPSISAELGKGFAMGDRVVVRPFLGAEAGVEAYVRAGGDVIIGNFGNGALLLRDDTTGQRYQAVSGPPVSGLSLTLGGDLSRVFASELLPEGGRAMASESRSRLRAGVAWQGERSSAFYGLTYLAPEFDTQPEGQLIGSLNVNLRF
jgi:hypothetical protein